MTRRSKFALAQWRLSRHQSGWIRASLMTLGGILLLLTCLVIAAVVWLGSESGLAFILDRAERSISASGGHFQATGARGGLYHGLTFDRVEWSDGKTRVVATDIAARWSLRSVLRREVVVPEVAIKDVTVLLPPSPDEPVPRTKPIEIPHNIGLPVSFELSRFKLERLLVKPATAVQNPDVDNLIEVTEIRFGLSYQDGAYNLHDIQAGLPWGKLTETRLSLNDTSPHAVVLRATFEGSVQAHPISVKAAALGNLNGLNSSVKGEFDQSPVSVDVRLRPLEPNPVVSATGWIRKLDLGRIDPPLPKTAIDLDFDLLNSRALPQIEQVKDEQAAGKGTKPNSVPVAQGQAAWRGTLALSNASSGPLSKKRLPLRTLSADLQLDAAEDSSATKLTLSSLKLGIPGANEQATVTGAVEIMLNEQHSVAGSDLPVIVAALQFRSIDAAQFMDGVSPTAMNGSFDLTRDLFNLDLSQSEGPLRQAVTLPGGGRAAIRASGRISDNAINLDSALVRLDSSRLTASGRATLTPPIDLAMGGSLENVNLDTWLPRQSAIDARFREGVINADWTVNGTVSPKLDARLSLNLGRSTLLGRPLTGRAVGRIKFDNEESATRLSETNLRLRLGSNTISVNGELGQSGDSLSISGLLGSPELFDPRLSGSVSFQGVLAGAIQTLQLQMKLSGEQVRWQADKNTVYRVSGLMADVNVPLVNEFKPDTALNVALRARQLELPDRKMSDLALTVSGLASQHEIGLQAVTDGQRAKLLAVGGLSLKAPLHWQGSVRKLTSQGKIQAKLMAPARLRASAAHVELSEFDFAVLDGRARVDNLVLRWAKAKSSPDPGFKLSGKLSQLPVVALLTLAGVKAVPPEIRGLRLAGDFSISGTDARDVSGAIQLGLTEIRLGGSTTEPSFGLVKPNRANLRINRGQLAGTVELNLPSLAFSRQFTGSDWIVDGRIRLASKIGGTLQQPVWDARLTGSGLSLFQPALGWRFSQGKLDASFADDVITVRTLALKSGEGTVTLEGRARLLKKSAGLAAGVLPLDGRFTLTSDRTVIPIGPGQRLVLSGQSAISSSRGGLNWTGKLRADEGLIEIAGSGAPTLPGDVVVVDEDAGTTATSASGNKDKKAESKKSTEASDSRQSPKVRTNLAIDLGRKLRIAGGGVNALLTGNLLLHGNLPDSPRVTGDVNIEDGSYFAYNQELTIERGAVRFSGALDNPLLDIVAIRPGLPVKAGVALGGTALSPRVQLTSTPPLSDAETLSWVVLGTPLSSAQAGAESLALKQAAAAFIGGEDGSLSGGGLADKIGVDVGFGYASDTGQAQAVTDAGSPTGLPGSASNNTVQANEKVFTLGKKLSKRLSVSYETGLEGVWNLLRLQYEISNRLSLRAQTGSESALDLIYFFSFD